jgi:hypothetical protein
MLIERRDGNVAVDVNRPVHCVVRDCGIVHGEREIIPASPSSIRPGVMDDGSRAVLLDVLSEPSLLFPSSLES